MYGNPTIPRIKGPTLKYDTLEQVTWVNDPNAGSMAIPRVSSVASNRRGGRDASGVALRDIVAVCVRDGGHERAEKQGTEKRQVGYVRSGREASNRQRA